MTTTKTILPQKSFKKEFMARGGESALKCYQCATCSSVCELAPTDAPFPRQQMLKAQWGLADELASDPAVWLCHQCNDCTARCPRDAKPGDVMQVVRSLAIENLAVPPFLGKLVGRVKTTWPLLIFGPFLFWVALIYAFNGDKMNELASITPENLVWGDIVPHWLIDTLFMAVAFLVVIVVFLSGSKFWKLIGKDTPERGGFLSNLIPIAIEIVLHKRFSKCGEGKGRKTGHMLLFWAFVTAFLTTIAVMTADYIFGIKAPISMSSWMKWLGNTSAILFVIGGALLLINRMGEEKSVGASNAFDNFFLFIALMTGFSGIATQFARFYIAPQIGIWIYISHLGLILTLFATFPYSKFAHMAYRTIAMVHERAVTK